MTQSGHRAFRPKADGPVCVGDGTVGHFRSETDLSVPPRGMTRAEYLNPWHLISSAILERYEAEAFVPQHRESLHCPHSWPTFARMKRDPRLSFTRGERA